MDAVARRLDNWFIHLINGTTISSLPLAAPGFLAGHQVPMCGGSQVGDPIRLTAKEAGRPFCVSGRSGSGKSVWTQGYIAYLADDGTTMLILDVFGDSLPKIFCRMLARKVARERLHVLDLGDTGISVPLNFLSASSEDPYRVVAVLLEHIESGADHIGTPTLDALRCTLVALLEGGASLLELNFLLLNEDYRERLLTKVKDPYTLSFFRDRFAAMSPEKRFSGLILPILNKLAPMLASPTARRMFGSSSMLDIRKLMDTPGAIVMVSLAIDKTRDMGTLVGRIILAEIERALLGRSDQPENKRNPVRLVVDEFAFLQGPSWNTLISQGRRFGCGTLVTFQNLAQLETKTYELLDNNAACRVIFGAGPTDASSLAAQVTNLPRDEARRLVLSLKTGEAIIVKAGEPPIRVKTPPPDEPKISAAFFAETWQAAQLRLGHPGTEVEAEILERHQHIEDAGVGPRQNGIHKEVRHARLPQLD